MTHKVAIRRVSTASAGTAREAECGCGWVSAQRGTMEMILDDAKEHGDPSPVLLPGAELRPGEVPPPN